MHFARFMASAAGRFIRVIAGLLMIAIGIFIVGGTGGSVLAVAGALPILTGLFNVCLLAPLLGAPFSGRVAQVS